MLGQQEGGKWKYGGGWSLEALRWLAWSPNPTTPLKRRRPPTAPSLATSPAQAHLDSMPKSLYPWYGLTPYQQPQDKAALCPRSAQRISASSPNLPPLTFGTTLSYPIASPQCGEPVILGL
ncbi:MICAL-like protein 1 [Pteropus alecto]|uniref:MICAL-like protein 1 n=1 Tax=Pteropus alecto TaxID=9402 RepID=L5KUD9_PTEAL|nr:MICAL-like protein 1 [Pteropus alecto]